MTKSNEKLKAENISYAEITENVRKERVVSRQGYNDNRHNEERHIRYAEDMDSVQGEDIAERHHLNHELEDDYEDQSNVRNVKVRPQMSLF